MRFSSSVRIAFLVSSFPRITEPWIINQITGLIDLGHHVEIFARGRFQGPAHLAVKQYGLLSEDKFHAPPNTITGKLRMLAGVLRKRFPLIPLALFKSLNFLRYGRPALALNLLYFTDILLDKEFDVIQCHFASNGVFAVTLKGLVGSKAKILTMLHGEEHRENPKKFRYLSEKSDLILVVSKKNRERLLQMGVPPVKVVQHPVGIELELFSPKWEVTEHQPRTNDEFVVVSVGRLAEVKGIPYGMKAIKKVIESSPSVKVIYNIVGGGALERDLKDLSRRLGINDVVHFLGDQSREEVARQLRRADVYLLPSLSEALPVVVIEALAVGCPVVATNVGSVGELVKDGKTGFLVPPQDVDAMADRILLLLRTPELKFKMGREGRKLVEDIYDVTKLNKTLVEIYQNLVKS